MRFSIEIDNEILNYVSLVTLAEHLRSNGIYEVKFQREDTYECRNKKNRWKKQIQIWKEFEISGETLYFTKADEIELNLLLVLLPKMFRTMRRIK